MNLYKNFTAKPYSFLVIDATFCSDNLSHFRKAFYYTWKNAIKSYKIINPALIWNEGFELPDASYSV